MWSLWVIAVRNVLRNKRRTLITLFALLLGVGVMVSIRGTLNGFQRSTIDSVTLGQTGALQIHRKGYMANVLSSPLNLDVPADAAFLRRILDTPHVTAVAPRILFGGMVNLNDQTLFSAMIAVDPAREFEALPLRKSLIEGDHGQFTAGKLAEGVVVTKDLAKALGKLDGQAAVLAPDKDGALSAENAQIVGTMNLNGPGERKIVLLPLAMAQRLLKLEGRATELAVAIDDIALAPQVAADLRQRLGAEFEVHIWDEIARFFKDVIFRQNAILSLVATVFMILMLIGVANTMLMSVLERTREIGTMMAVGVRRRQILVLFLFEAAAIGLTGGLIGGAAGAAIVAWLNVRGIEMTPPGSNVPFIMHPFVSPAYLAQVAGIACLGAVVFALYPAWRASRLRPVEALAGR